MWVLVVDHSPTELHKTAALVENLGHQVATARNVRQARRHLESEPIDSLLIEMDGKNEVLPFLRQVRKEWPSIASIVYTDEATVETAIESIKCGAWDYLQRPFHLEDVAHILKEIAKKVDRDKRSEALEKMLSDEEETLLLESEEESMRELFGIAKRAAASEAGLLILGPSGTGKSVLAQWMHNQSSRRRAPFVTVHCPSLSMELLESELFGHVKGAFTSAVGDTWGKVAAADGGTLFLDEIGELPGSIQPKLLRLLQEQQYERVGEAQSRKSNVRVIAATNRDLKAAVGDGGFREDLYYRLNIVPLHMPGLADRPADILPLAENFLRFFARRMGKPDLRFTDEFRAALLHYPWPGNLRELRNLIERMVILTDGNRIDIDALPGEFKEKNDTMCPLPGHAVSLAELEEEHIRRTVSRCETVEEAAEILGINTATLYRKRKRMGME